MDLSYNTWRKARRSADNGDSCVEVAVLVKPQVVQAA